LVDDAMAHELLIRNGKASMFYVGGPPWHGLGTPLSAPATAAEAIAAASLDWDVEKVPLFAMGGGRSHRVKGKFAVLPTDRASRADCPAFGIVGVQYTPLQNREAFSFLDPIVGAGAAVYHTAGALGDGERIWMLAKLPGELRVVGDDIADKYLLLSNSHDGESSVQVKFTPVRVVCQNTLTQALRGGPTVRVSHHRDLRTRLGRAERLLGLARDRFDEMEGVFRQMVTVQLDTKRLRDYLAAVFADPADPTNEAAWARIQSNRSWAEHFFAEGAGNRTSGVKGTLWAAYNGVAELVDHRVTAKRLQSAWFGSGYQAKARAYQQAVERLVHAA
jgi:phage/plasmid-like protein (TIGR03299 family)